MTLKEIFLNLNGEILNSGNPGNRLLSADESRIHNYRSGISALIKQENRQYETSFFIELQAIYEQTNLPLLNIADTLCLFRKFIKNKEVFSCLRYCILKLGKKPFAQEAGFWGQFVYFLILGPRETFKSKQNLLNTFCKIAKQIFTSENYDKFNIFFGFILNHCQDSISKALVHYRIGVNILGFVLTNQDLKNTKTLENLFSIIKKFNLDAEVYERFFIQFIKKERAPFVYDSKFFEFLELYLIKLPNKSLADFSTIDWEKLFFIYNCNRHIYDKIDPIDFTFLADSNAIRSKTFRKEIIEKLLSNYGISYFFIRNFNESRLSYLELEWFKNVVQGKNLFYSNNLPFDLNKKIIHKFNTVSNDWRGEFQNNLYSDEWNQSINNLSVTNGLIWSAFMFELKDLNYTNTVLHYIQTTGNTEFWVKVMIQLYKNGLRSNEHISEIMDYIDNQVFTLQRAINFKSKKISNLIEESNRWHLAMENTRYGKTFPLIKLPYSSISPFKYEENDKKFIIKQLKSNRELMFEGNALSHCVGSYTNKCMKFGSFIFSLRKLIDSEVPKEINLITIEINNNRIVQKKGKRNRFCKPFEDRIIKIWAKENGLS
jgi:hypothetical protein